MRYEYGLVVNGTVFRQNGEEAAQRRYESMKNKCKDMSKINIVRRPIVEWEPVE